MDPTPVECDHQRLTGIAIVIHDGIDISVRIGNAVWSAFVLQMPLAGFREHNFTGSVDHRYRSVVRARGDTHIIHGAFTRESVVSRGHGSSPMQESSC